MPLMLLVVLVVLDQPDTGSGMRMEQQLPITQAVAVEQVGIPRVVAAQAGVVMVGSPAPPPVLVSQIQAVAVPVEVPPALTVVQA